MPKHLVSFELPKREMGKVDAHFFIQKDGATMGEIRISKGGIDYRPANRQKKIRISWTQFDTMVKDWNGEKL
jgi:hypothetical protein